MVRIAIAALAIAALAACEPRGRIVVVPGAAATGDIETVFIGTTRAPGETADVAFSSERSLSTHYARLDVAVPPLRQPGEITWTPPGQTPDPLTEFVTARETAYAGERAFRADLAAALARAPRGRREAVIFVHGFNSTYAEGAYRLAQLGHDLGLDGVLVHYSWPSLGHPLGYAYDRDSALFARDGLEDLMEEVVAAGANRLLIIAHSMGAALTMEALRQMAIAGDTRVKRRIAGVVLISPDIDVDVFNAQARRIGELPQPFLIFTSKRDRALALSARLTGQTDRLGNVSSVEEVANLDVTLLDTTAFTRGIGHFNLGNSPALIALLSRISDVDIALARDRTGRTGLLPGVALTVQNATQIVLSPVVGLPN